MRIASILAASGVIAWLFCTLWNLPVSRSLLLWNGWMFVITLTATFVAARIPQKDWSYAIFYALMLGPLVLFTLGTALQFGLSLGDDALTAFLVFCFVGAIFVKVLRGHTPDSFVTKVMLVQGYIFCVCGLLSLASAIPPCTALQFRLRLGLSLYWLAISGYSFAQSLGIVRARALWVSLDSWLAGAMCVAFLLPLTVSLQGIQPELGRQHSVDELALSELQHLAEVQ